MKNKIAAAIIIFLVSSTLLIGVKGKTIDQKISELEKKLQQVQGKEKVDLLNHLAYLYISKSPVKCIEYAEQALALAQKLNHLSGEGRALQNIGIGNAILGKSEKALEYFREALEAAKKADDKKLYAKVLVNTGSVYTRMNNPHKALEFQLESLKIEKEMGRKPGIAAVLSNIGITYQQLFDSAGALDYYLNSLKIYDQLENPNEKEVSNVLLNIGIVYIELNRPAKALEYLRKAIEIKKKIGDRAGIAMVHGAIASGYQLQNDYRRALDYNKKALKIAEEIGIKLMIPRCTGNIGTIYEALRDYHQALDFFRKSLEISTETGDKLSMGLALISIGRVELELQNHAGALENIQKGLNIAKKIGKKDLALRGYKILSRLYEAGGDYKKAMEYSRRLNQTDKELLNEKNQVQINKLQAIYEAEKKAKEIEMLKKDNEIKDLRLSNAEFARNAFIMGFLLVVIILALLFKKYLYLFSFWKKKKYIGQFRLMHKIASGGMGTIFKAHGITNKSEITAVKILKDELFTHEISKKRFKRESAIIDRLEHPNIVRIKERGESGRQLFIAMEFLEGSTLEHRLNTEGQLPLDEALHIMRQTADTIAYIHGKSIIHRDLKPANIMLIEKNGDPNFVKLLDFGLARAEFDTRITQSANFLGTTEYVPPEQILDAVVSPAGDIFAMGVIFYRMLCGKSPFPGATVIDIMRKVIGEEPEAVSESRPGIPAELNGLVMRMVQKEPGPRPSAESVKNTLENLNT
jgi:tetratricopeptide (TPR) repeat protein/tRNA A-37 threonylcarbamoyl transferase component Bud32